VSVILQRWQVLSCATNHAASPLTDISRSRAGPAPATVTLPAARYAAHCRRNRSCTAWPTFQPDLLCFTNTNSTARLCSHLRAGHPRRRRPPHSPP